VDIFFCLSGYLICTLLLQEKQRTKTISMSRFYTRRAFRILPPMLLFIATLVLLWTVGFSLDLGFRDVFAVLFFYRNFINGSWYTGHFWSLAIEEQFYAAAPLFLLLLNRKWAVGCASVLIVVCVATRYFEYAHGMFPDSLLQFRTENRYDGLLWGMILAFGLYAPASRAWLQRHLSSFLCVVVIVASAFLLTKFESEPFRRTVVAAAMPILIGYTVLNAQSLAGAVLELSPLRWLGRLSYSLYIWQMLFLPEQSRPLGAFQDFPLNLICPFLCAAASYYLVEKPMIKLGHRLANAPGAGPAERYE
jgi:peptidoglycan/LPS O-acetylase OafA/YrhL